MAKIKVRVTAQTTYTLETEDYANDWKTQCDEDGDMEEGGEYPPVPANFAVERFQEALEEGNEDLAMVLETGTIDVKKA